MKKVRHGNRTHENSGLLKVKKNLRQRTRCLISIERHRLDISNNCTQACYNRSGTENGLPPSQDAFPKESNVIMGQIEPLDEQKSYHSAKESF